MDRILKTAEISTEILKLIHETQDCCYLVTPYFKPWPLLDRELEIAKEKKRRVVIICRADQDKRNLNRIHESHKRFGFELLLVNNLHMKLYLNEKRAIVSSMNLYDSSQERNYELGYIFDSKRQAKKFYEEIISGDVLALAPANSFPGWFHNDEESEREEILALIEGFSEKGFCVVCGQKCDLDPSASPYLIRCNSCWSNDRDIQNYDLRTRHCHYCGEMHVSTGSQPLHSKCKEELKRVLESRFYSR